MNFDFNALTSPAPLLLGAFLATGAWILVAAKMKPEKPLYQETSTEDKAKLQKLQNELAAATEHQEKIAEVHAYTLALEKKVKDLESLEGGDVTELGLKVKVLEGQLVEKSDVEAKLAVALQQLEDYKAKAEMFDSVVGSNAAPVEAQPEAVVETPVVAEAPAAVEAIPEPVTPVAPVFEQPVEEPAAVAVEEVAAVEPFVEEPAAVVEPEPVAPVVEPAAVAEPEPVVAPAAFTTPVPVVEPEPVVPAAIAQPEPVAPAPAPVEEVAAYEPAVAHRELEPVGMTVLQNDSPQLDTIVAGSTAPAIEDRPALRVETVAQVAPVAAATLLDNRDPLEKIEGIQQVYQMKLYEAGILTFAQLAAASPSRITEIIEPQNWQQIDIMKWRREAALYAAGVKE